jgi:hypothetical protein
MINITIVGAGAFGGMMADKYGKSKMARLKAVVSPHKPDSGRFPDMPYFDSAAGWRRNFGKPGSGDVFDLCVHADVLINVLKEFVAIGAKNFILPKPVVLNRKDLGEIEKLEAENGLKMLVSSQWYYSEISRRIGKFIKDNRGRISRVDVGFSRSFEPSRKGRYTAITAFLPHIVQMLVDHGLVSKKTPLVIQNVSDDLLKMRYMSGKTAINVVSDLSSEKRREIMRVFLDGASKPALNADLSFTRSPSGRIKYPSLTVNGKKSEVRQDILESMIHSKLGFFNKRKGTKPSLTIRRYLSVAKEVIRAVEESKKLVVVIGGGIFGILSALEIGKKGYPVAIFEKEEDVIMGASLVNQCRVHMGYHYPRDEETARNSRQAMGCFEKMFGPSVVRHLDNYYLLAKEGSRVSHEKLMAFCKKMDLPHEIEWPKNTGINKDKIAVSLKVPEPIFDANRLREALKRKLASSENVTLQLATAITGIKRAAGGFEVEYSSNGIKRRTSCSAVINATYGGGNTINKMAGLPIEDCQFELCEVPVVKAPWSGTGWSVIDGPFFGVMPFGFAKEYLLYDVELSVLERVIGKIPKFKFDVEHYDDKKRKAQRFAQYIKKWKPWLREVDECEHLYSMYVVRMVLPHKEKTDTRPTIIKELSPGFWQLFSGKVTTSVPNSILLAEMVDGFLASGRNKAR